MGLNFRQVLFGLLFFVMLFFVTFYFWNFVGTKNTVETSCELRNSIFYDIAIDVPPAKIKNEIVPGFKFVATDLYGKCAFETNKYSSNRSPCEDFGNGISEHIVMQGIMSGVFGRCNINDIQSSPIVMDVGANLGYYTSVMRSLGCRVISVEPQIPLNRFFRATMDVNGWSNDGSVTLFSGALGVTHGKLRLENLWVPGGRETNKWRNSTLTYDAPVVPVSQILPREVEFIKIDVDGPEVVIFKALAPLLGSHIVKNIICELSMLVWERLFNISNEESLSHFNEFYKHNYEILILTQFDLFAKVMDKLQSVSPYLFYSRALRIPQVHFEELMLFIKKEKIVCQIYIHHLGS